MSGTVQQLEMALIRRVVHGGSINRKLRATITLQFKGNKHHLERDFQKLSAVWHALWRSTIQRHFSVKTMNNKYYFHTKTLSSILQSDRHFDSQSTAQTQAQKQNVRGKCHYVNTGKKEGRTELQREYSGYRLGNMKCWTLMLLFYDQPLLHSNKCPHFNQPWITLMPCAICTSLKLMWWLENQMPISSEVSATHYFRWLGQSLSVHRHMCSDYRRHTTEK